MAGGTTGRSSGDTAANARLGEYTQPPEDDEKLEGDGSHSWPEVEGARSKYESYEGPLPRTTKAVQEACGSQIAQVTFVTASWWAAAIYVTLMFKLMSESALPPFTLTWLVNTMTGLIALGLAQITTWAAPPIPEMHWDEVAKVCLLGLIQGCEIGCLNKSLEGLTISERTMLQNINVLFMMILAWICDLERISLLRVVAGLLLAGGGCLQGLDASHLDSIGRPEEEAHLRGIVFMLISMVLTSVKWSIVQLVMQHSTKESALGQMSKLQFAGRVQPITGSVCLVLAYLFEDALNRESLLRLGLLTRVPLLSIGITVITCAELKLVQLTSAVAVGVLVNLHHIPLVVVGVVVLHDPIDIVGFGGFASAMLGGLCYAVARCKDGNETDVEQALPVHDVAPAPVRAQLLEQAEPPEQAEPLSPVNCMETLPNIGDVR